MYGTDIEFYKNKPDECTDLLSQYLNKGHLGLLLGSGASSALTMPGWKDLVLSIASEIKPSLVTPGKTDYTGHELKAITQQFKKEINNQKNYHDAVRKHLYKGVDFNFNLAKKELLIALSALIVGKRRGNVQEIFTFNFDSVLEWYLQMLGLDVNTIVKQQMLTKATDVNITHVHGYLPAPQLMADDSDFLIFSQKEFVDRLISSEDYWKKSFYDFFRKYTFLSIGLSVDSLIEDVCPYLREMNKKYNAAGLKRMYPYGVAFLSPATTPTENLSDLLEDGIIPCVLPTHDDVPLNIFEILRKACLK